MTANPRLRQRFSLLVPTLIAINVVIYGMWFFAATDSSNLHFMAENFLVSWDGLVQGRYWILLSACFSHNLIWHLLLNMFVLNSFGRILEEFLGRARFLSFYLLAGVFSSLCHAVVSAFVLRNPSLSALGASGAVAGLILLFALMFPKEKILFFGIIPVPAIFGGLLFIGLDIWGLTAQAEGGGLPIGHGAHLGGAFFGIAFYFLFVRAKWKRQNN